MKHVGCYIGEYSGLFKVEHRHVGEKLLPDRRGAVWTPYTYTLTPIFGAEVYYLDIMLKDIEEAPEEGAKVEISSKRFERNDIVIYKIKKHQGSILNYKAI